MIVTFLSEAKQRSFVVDFSVQMNNHTNKATKICKAKKWCRKDLNKMMTSKSSEQQEIDYLLPFNNPFNEIKSLNSFFTDQISAKMKGS